MSQQLPSEASTENPRGQRQESQNTQAEMADLKIFWGPEICRLEYLVHLLETGRVVDEHRKQSA